MRLFPALSLTLALAVAAGFDSPRTAAQSTGRVLTPFVASWATSQQAPEPENNQPGLDPAKLTDVTVREIVHLSTGGDGIRVHLSNAFGRQPLRIDDVHLARAVRSDGNAVVPGTDRRVRFTDGRTSVTIPIGAEVLSTVVPVPVSALSDIAISFHMAEPPAGQTAHPGSHATSYLLHGEHAGDPELAGAEKMVRWLQLAEIDVTAAPNGQTVVAFGDSITDGHASTTDGNDRWPDVLARRLQATGMAQVGVANEGIGGNHLLTNGLGENALERLDRDLIALPAVKNVILLEGINDIGMLARGNEATAEQHEALVRRMEAAYEQIIERAHAHGIGVIGGTLTPFMGSDYYKPTAANEADRNAVNAWIRQSGHFDAVIDFDHVMRDPAHPDHMLPGFDSGDHLHPGPAGYKAMGDAIPLPLFR